MTGMVLGLLALAHAGDLRVVGGHVADQGAWPDAAGIVFNGSDVGCSGVLVAPDVVLTAGHCAGGITDVVLDNVDYSDESTGERIAVAQTIEYPHSWGNYDISVLILAEESAITPRLIATGCIRDYYLHDGASVAIVGYGAIDERGREYTTELHEAFSIITDADCSDLNKGCFPRVSPGGELGAGGGGIDACYGDSGGPLYLQTPEGDFVVGLTSRSYDNVNLPCEEGGIYVRPDAVFDWIQDVSGRELSEPECPLGEPPNRAPVPTADFLRLDVGVTKTLQIHANDPESWQAHTYAIVRDPSLGTASIDANGLLTYTAGDTAGDDTLDVEVTEVGDDPLSGQVTVEIHIAPGVVIDTDPPEVEDTGPTDVALEHGGCGCDAGSTSAPWLLGLLPLLIRRRTRR